jgi:co-chaperonin GroES (HSP10)
MTIQPINNFILVEIDNESERTESGLMVPGVKGEKTEAYAIRAIIVDISSDIRPTIRNFKRGSKVLVAKWEGQNVSANGKSYIIIKPEHVMALIK